MKFAMKQQLIIFYQFTTEKKPNIYVTIMYLIFVCRFSHNIIITHVNETINKFCFQIFLHSFYQLFLFCFFFVFSVILISAWHKLHLCVIKLASENPNHTSVYLHFVVIFSICSWFNASVLCTFRNATIYTGNRYGTYGADKLIANLRCLGNETDLQECNAGVWLEDRHYCNTSNTAVAVNCRKSLKLRQSE